MRARPGAEERRLVRPRAGGAEPQNDSSIAATAQLAPGPADTELRLEQTRPLKLVPCPQCYEPLARAMHLDPPPRDPREGTA
eukprot:4943274-Prymnesium_polylepis.4